MHFVETKLLFLVLTKPTIFTCIISGKSFVFCTACPGEYIKLGCKCVWFSSLTGVTYDTAADQCASKVPGSRLLIVENDEENKIILDYRRENASKSICT